MFILHSHHCEYTARVNMMTRGRAMQNNNMISLNQPPSLSPQIGVNQSEQIILNNQCPQHSPSNVNSSDNASAITENEMCVCGANNSSASSSNANPSMTPQATGQLLQSASLYNSHRQIPINIKECNGEDIEFFVQNICQAARLNSWSDEEAILYLKTKLCGQALKFYMNSASCNSSTSLNDVCNILKEFFIHESTMSSALAEFQSIKLIPGESMKNLAFRVENCARKTYEKVQSEEAMDQIMAAQFFAAIPTEIKKHFINEELPNFRAMVKKAATITTNMQMFGSNSAVEHVNFHETESIRDTVASLEQRIEALASRCSLCGEKHNSSTCPNLSSIFSKSASSNQDMPKCWFCGAQGHFMANCSRYRESNQRQNGQFNQNHRYQVPVQHQNHRGFQRTFQHQPRFPHQYNTRPYNPQYRRGQYSYSSGRNRGNNPRWSVNHPRRQPNPSSFNSRNRNSNNDGNLN